MSSGILGIMPKPKEVLEANGTLTEVIKEMAKPRVAESARELIMEFGLHVEKRSASLRREIELQEELARLMDRSKKTARV